MAEGVTTDALLELADECQSAPSLVLLGRLDIPGGAEPNRWREALVRAVEEAGGGQLSRGVKLRLEVQVRKAFRCRQLVRERDKRVREERVREQAARRATGSGGGLEETTSHWQSSPQCAVACQCQWRHRLIKVARFAISCSACHWQCSLPALSVSHAISDTVACNVQHCLAT